jgi:DNA-binding XRE family transcriptional regulator
LGAEMEHDTQFVFGLEIRVLELEEKVHRLEQALSALSPRAGAKAPSPLPDAIVQRIEAGEHPVRAVRLHRLMTQKELGEASGIRANHISAIECGMEFGLKTAKRLATALAVPVAVLK